MKIKVGDLKRIIKEELGALSKRSINEAGDVDAWYKRQPRVPPALQAAAIQRVGSFVFGGDRQLRSMVGRAQELKTPVPQEILDLLPIFDQLLDQISVAGEAVNSSVKRVVRKGPAAEPEVALPPESAPAPSIGKVRGGLARAIAPDTEDF